MARAHRHAELHLRVVPECPDCLEIVNRTRVVRDKAGDVIGTVARGEDGRNIIKPQEPTGNSLFHMSAIVFAQAMHEIDRDAAAIFSRWAGLSDAEWSPFHEELCALALMHYFCDAKDSGSAAVPEAVKGVADWIDRDELPPLDRPLNAEIRSLFSGLFGGVA
jgi:hypothetical protein